MTPAELLDYFRAQVRDDVAPYLWTDEEIMVYMDTAQSMFVRLTGGIFDVSSDACTVSLSAGERFSDLSPLILNIRRAVYNDERELNILNLSDIDKLTTSDYGVVRNLSLSNSVGRVSHMVIGEQRDIARWIMIPDTDATVSLAIARLPLERITSSSQEFEVDEIHHPFLAEWMKREAYRKQDADTINPKAAEVAEASFRAYCDQVWREWERYRHKPRTVAYGGI